MTTKSPASAAPSFVSKRAARSRSCCTWSSICLGSGSVPRRGASTPWYSPSVATGRTPISNENSSGAPASGMSGKSRSGSPTGTMPDASTALEYQRPSEERTASSRTASRPTWRITTGGGILPLRKPGRRRSRPIDRAASCTRRFSSSGLTCTATRTRDSGCSVTVVVMRSVTAAMCRPRYLGPVTERILTRTERARARLLTGPLAHFVAGLTDWVVLVATLLRSRRRERRAARP